MSKSPAVAFALLLAACGGSADPTLTGDDANVTKTSGTHDVFVCKRSNTNVASGVYMFAHDDKGEITNGTKAGYCQLTVDAKGEAFGQYSCWVADTVEGKTSDGQLALLFRQSLGDGAFLYTQLNLPKDLLDKKGGSGKLRDVSRAPKDLSTPIGTGSGVETLDCSEQKVKFEEPK